MKWEKRTMVMIVFILLGALVFNIYLRKGQIRGGEYQEFREKENLLRLHVVANSNSLRDYHIKRKVRKELSAKINELIAESGYFTSPKDKIESNQTYLRKLITNKLKGLGVSYGVELHLDNFSFPRRNYGYLTLLAGDYEALRITLGAGQGENWWCVLFPPFCFVDSLDEVSREELEQLASQSEEEMPIEFKFKSKEVLKENQQMVKSKINWLQILKTSFPEVGKLISPVPEEE